MFTPCRKRILAICRIGALVVLALISFSGRLQAQDGIVGTVVTTTASDGSTLTGTVVLPAYVDFYTFNPFPYAPQTSFKVNTAIGMQVYWMPPSVRWVWGCTWVGCNGWGGDLGDEHVVFQVDALGAQIFGVASLQCATTAGRQNDLYGYLWYSSPGTKQITVTAINCGSIMLGTSPVVLAKATHTVIITGDGQLRAGAMFLDEQGKLAPQVAVSTDPSNPTIAHVPLGRGLRIDSFDQQNRPVSASFSLSNQDVVQEGLEQEALFHDFAVLRYASADPSEVPLQPVHLGSVLLTVVPAAPGMPTGYIKLLVENPTSLGSTHAEFDKLISAVAQKTGVPPQYMKAVADHESQGSFDRYTYRYEPIGPDTGDMDVISRGSNLRTQSPYADYRLATAPYYGNSDPPLKQGTNIDTADVDIRDEYFIDRPDCSNPSSRLIVRRKIEPCDTFVGASEIYFDNYAQNWWKGKKATSVKADPSLLEFTAQTGLASSFGIMQVMYVTAVGTRGWLGINAQDGKHPAASKNPSYLFDTDENITLGGGSLLLGANQLAYWMSKKVTQNTSQPFTSESDMRRAFRYSLGKYNKSASYPSAVIRLIDQYVPTSNGPIL